VTISEVAKLAQSALDIYRAAAQENGKDSIYVEYAILPLIEAKMSHYDAQRAYSYLRSHGFVVSTHQPRSTRNFHLYILPTGTVEEEIARRKQNKYEADQLKSQLDQEKLIEAKIASHLLAIEKLQIELIQLKSNSLS